MLSELMIIMAAVAFEGPADEGYRADIEQWRQKRESDLKADDGWLTLVGLHWLRPGETRLGSDPASDVHLPASAPATLGVLTLGEDGMVGFRAEPGVSVTVDGKPFTSGKVRTDAEGKPDVLSVGTLRVIPIKRGNRYALRIKDNASETRGSFAGLRWYPVDPTWRIKARFVPHASPTRVVMDTIVGEPQSMESPGDVVFERDGKEYRLRAVKEGDHHWFVLRDRTSGRTTHGGARQLPADPPKDGVVTLDFNKATNLPCAYTTYATCPLPPPENRLPLAITAGEMTYTGGSR